MKRLPQYILLMRHGVAVEPSEWDGSDDERPLTSSGRKKTTQAASGFLEQFQPTTVFSSGLVRADQTADCIDAAYKQAGIQPPLRKITSTLNHSSTFTEWKKYLEGFLDKTNSDEIILAVGHEPSISLILAGHLGIKAPVFSFKKAGIAVISPIQSLGRCELVAFIPPRFLRGMNL